MIDGKLVVRRVVLCLIMTMILSAAAVPVLRTGSSAVWAKNVKKTTTKSNKKKKAKKAVKKEGFLKENGYWYYYVNGKRMTGWIEVGVRRYYAVPKGSARGRLVMGWQTIDDTDCFFREEGRKGVICSQALNGSAKVNGISCIFEEGEIVACKHAGSTEGFVNKVGELARLNQAKNNILASLVVAQACLETGFGRNIYHNNLFGIREGNGYRKYDSFEESIEDYVKFMHTYIPWIFGVRDWAEACSIIGRAGYAEAGGYGSALISIVQGNNLTRFNK